MKQIYYRMCEAWAVLSWHVSFFFRRIRCIYEWIRSGQLPFFECFKHSVIGPVKGISQETADALNAELAKIKAEQNPYTAFMPEPFVLASVEKVKEYPKESSLLRYEFLIIPYDTHKQRKHLDLFSFDYEKESEEDLKKRAYRLWYKLYNNGNETD